MSLPSGYKRLEYIESSGTQYIDTGFVPNQDTGFVIDAEVLDTNTSGECHISSVFKSPNYFTCRLNSSYNGFAYRYGTGILTAVSYAGGHYARHIFTRSKNKAQVDGSTVTEFTYETFNVGYNLYIFAGNNEGRGAIGYTKLKLYSYMLYDNGTLIRDYIPCQTPDGQIGLWDDVNSVFYGNAGTGTFTAGPVIAISVALSDITQLEYIESSGTQYVDTGFKPNNNSRVVLDFEPTASYSSIVGIFGTRDAKSGTAANMFVFWNSGTNTFRTDYFGTQKTMTVSTILARQTVDKDKNVTTIGSVSASNTVSTGQCSNNLYLFCTNNAGTAQYFAKLKLYSCQIYDNGTLIRDYIAAKLSDGTIGLYDKLHGLLYTNVGTGTFIAGPVVTSPSIFVNIDGIWKPINNIYVNINNLWQKLT